MAPESDEDWGAPPLEFLRDRLGRLASRHHINFAVDDFGVGYASLDRIASLPIAHIKVDRAVLGHPLAIKELRLVVDVANELLLRGCAATGRTVIVEGYDEEIKVPLADIYEAGIHLVQGYIMGEQASRELHPLGAGLREKIAGLVQNGRSAREWHNSD